MSVTIQQFGQGEQTAKGVSGGFQTADAATPEAFGAAGGAELAQAGAVTEKAADTLEKTAVRIQTEDNETTAKAADTATNGTLRATLFDPTKGYFTLKGKDAIDAYQPTMEALQKAHDDTVATIASPEARKMYTDIASKRLDNALNTMSQHAAIERRTYVDGVSIARATSAADDATAYYSDPAKREGYRAAP